MQRPLLPPTLDSVVAEAFARLQEQARLGAFTDLNAALDKDPMYAKSFAYHDLAKLDAALQEFDALPVSTPHRAKVAGALILVCVEASMDDSVIGDSPYIDRAAQLADIAEQDPDMPPQLHVVFHAVRTQRAYAGMRKGTSGVTARVLQAEYEKLLELIDHYAPEEVRGLAAAIYETSANGMGHLAAVMEGDPAAQREVQARFETTAAGTVPGSWTHVSAEAARLISAMQSAIYRGEPQVVREASRRLQHLAEKLPESHPLRELSLGALSTAALFLAFVEGEEGGIGTADRWASGAAWREEAGRLSRDESIPDFQRAAHLMVLAIARMREQTAASMDEAVELCDRALQLLVPGDPFYAQSLHQAGQIRLARCVAFGDMDDRTERAIVLDLLEKAQRHASQGGDLATYIGLARDLSMAYFLDGQVKNAVGTAVTGLRGRVWSALLQPRAADVHQVARDSSEDAVFAAGICLKANLGHVAVWALEMGRGLIVHAATQARDVVAQLEERGHAELAREWRVATATSSAAQAPAALRRRVMSALTGVELVADGSLAKEFEEAMRALPNPPTADEVRAALIALEMDALVYLVPGRASGSVGFAAVIQASEPPLILGIPALVSEQAARFEEIIGAMARGPARDLRPPEKRQGGAADLDALCEWAWEAAIGPLLGAIEAPQGSPQRIVLIPVGGLSHIPWHAARRTVDGRERYAVEDVVFSYAASARMFCAAAWSRDVPLTESGLIVSDPDTAGAASPLPGARVEATAIRERFYPTARFLGRETDGSEALDGPGRPEEVRAWLADSGTSSADPAARGTVLHLACHATVRASQGDEDTSYLLLHQGRRLSVEELIDTLATSKGRELALAVVAACRSSESGRGYDEGLSLATALLAHNVRSVISARWSVPDRETSVLMFMVHYFLQERGLRPSDALREAQLWMLRGDALPEGTPDSLREVPLSADVQVWGAFVHAGR